jgi:hypothetical protein
VSRDLAVVEDDLKRVDEQRRDARSAHGAASANAADAAGAEDFTLATTMTPTGDDGAPRKRFRMVRPAPPWLRLCAC